MTKADAVNQILTVDKLRTFVRLRNASSFQSNVQFISDLLSAGLDVDDLPLPVGNVENGYRWETALGTLIEHPGGRMEFIEN